MYDVKSPLHFKNFFEFLKKKLSNNNNSIIKLLPYEKKSVH